MNEYTPTDFGITDQDIVFEVALDCFPEEANAIIDALYPDGMYDIDAARINCTAAMMDTYKYVNDARVVAQNWKAE